MQQMYEKSKHGFLISHNLKRERGAKKEMNDLINSYSSVSDGVVETNVQVNSSSDIDKQLALELSELKQKKGVFDTGVDCLLFTAIDKNPMEFLETIFSGAKRDNFIAKETQRIVPLQRVDMASSPEKLLTTTKELISEFNFSNYKTFAIKYACRNNSVFDKKQIIDTVAKMMPDDLKVDLNNPDITLYIEIFYRGLGVSLIETQKVVQLMDFNIQKYLNDEHN
ncbi:hypothetical protein EIN_495720 [Entamoeba invadens IP1]|uniref:THUMP domain-containing protein n=1 Tax=Entamoeba invadens IP1 TaxID=370355 RepID=A0A0A1TZQ5_ENTIV|nr:hypothetical protein EIN_495720 [Entamoeba invadens IP1]ELP87107.1 hypothetical protein EIN_495720 [Entamoeba invadens IP1]|eukprot:XP_004253878.1 hypothetical protein EIN_495720 [Entamoeba invadens IP1]